MHGGNVNTFTSVCVLERQMSYRTTTVLVLSKISQSITEVETSLEYVNMAKATKAGVCRHVNKAALPVCRASLHD